jgi:hypothetical protein
MIYLPLVSEGYEWINCCDGADYEIFDSFDGSPRRDTWTPVQVRRVRASPQQAFIRSDFPWLGDHALMFRQPALDALRQMLLPNGEILPLATEDMTPLYVLNVTRIIDALDLKRSEIIRFPGSDRIMLIRSAVMFEPLVRSVDVFRLPHRASSTYVSNRFVQTVQECGLEGIEFHPVELSVTE